MHSCLMNFSISFWRPATNIFMCKSCFSQVNFNSGEYSHFSNVVSAKTPPQVVCCHTKARRSVPPKEDCTAAEQVANHHWSCFQDGITIGTKACVVPRTWQLWVPLKTTSAPSKWNRCISRPSPQRGLAKHFHMCIVGDLSGHFEWTCFFNYLLWGYVSLTWRKHQTIGDDFEATGINKPPLCLWDAQKTLPKNTRVCCICK